MLTVSKLLDHKLSRQFSLNYELNEQIENRISIIARMFYEQRKYFRKLCSILCLNKRERNLKALKMIPTIENEIEWETGHFVRICLR